MAQVTVNIPRESTIKDMMLSQRIASEAAADLEYKGKVANATSKTEVDGLFAEWWHLYYNEELFTKSEMLERWFGRVLDDWRVHGVKSPLYGTSNATAGELTDDSIGLVCVPSTASAANQDDFASLPQFWCVEVAAEKNVDGSHVIHYVEHIDDINDVRSGEYLTWVLQKNTWTREWDEGGYRYLKMRSHSAPGYEQWPQGQDRTGKIYAYMANPKYPAGERDGVITCGTGLAPVNWVSHTQGVSKWRTRGAQYSGASGNLAKFLYRMNQLKYAQKGNRNTVSGCHSYSFQYTAAVSETGVERIILTTQQAANLFVGSSVQIGVTVEGNDRNNASMYSICRNKLITAIENIEIEEVEYSAVYVDNGGVTFDTTAGSTIISTDPYWSGWNDEVLGVDGSRYNATSGKEPGMIQKVEFMTGAYLIVSDELWNWTTDENGDYNFECYTCHDQTKVASSITDDYAKQEDLTMIIPQGTQAAWKYIADMAISKDAGVLWPGNIEASGSGVGCSAAFSCDPAASGVRAAWVFGALAYGGLAGLACRRSHSSVGGAVWFGALGAPGLAG